MLWVELVDWQFDWREKAGVYVMGTGSPISNSLSCSSRKTLGNDRRRRTGSNKQLLPYKECCWRRLTSSWNWICFWEISVNFPASAMPVSIFWFWKQICAIRIPMQYFKVIFKPSQAYHSSLQASATIGNMALLPINTKFKGPAPPGGICFHCYD